MKPNCPECAADSNHVRKYGYYIRKSDSKMISRYHCKACEKHFSQARFSICYRQNKRRLNPLIARSLCSLVSQRRVALILGISRTTVARKLKFLAQHARANQKEWIQKMPPFLQVHFDDLETIEHTKCKPVTVTMAVESETRKILGFSVAEIPAKGHLAKISRKKYGRRSDNSRKARRELFKELQAHISEVAEFYTDQHHDYPLVLREYFPYSKHQTFKRVEGCVTGQRELKKIKFDPLFSINHTFAMLRANINRLIRSTWCTTKKLDGLRDHLAIYVDFHNSILTR